MPSNVSRWLTAAASLVLVASAAAQDGPPPSDGPSATSDRSPDRYDEVGYATWYGAESGGKPTASGAKFDPAAFTAAHRTLPLGSYVEVTSLDTGRTVLVLINDRGPSTPGLMIDLSQAAAKAIGVTGRKAVRVRRVTPTPVDQNALRNGQAASPRLDTPPALLAGLRAKLAGDAPTPVAVPSPAPQPVPTPTAQRETKPVKASAPKPTPSPRAPVPEPAKPKPAPKPAPKPVATPAPAPQKQGPIATRGKYYIQIGTFSSKDRAAALAKTLGGAATPFKMLWRVRTGPFPDAKTAAQARDAAAARGYGDARVVRED